ncbi:MAG: hypothetical protein ACOYMV_12525 [Verrucomicrobiia bacterium]
MTTPTTSNVPDDFIKLLQQGMREQGLSLLQLATRAKVSHSYLWRLFNKQRGLPADEIIMELATILEIYPREKLLYAAGRSPESIKEELKREQVPQLLRITAELNTEDLQHVMKVARKLAERHQKRKAGK